VNSPEVQTIIELENTLAIKTPSPEQPIKPNWKHIKDYQLFIKRDDLIHTQVSGNKWRKLKYQLLSVLSQNTDASHRHIISFGGGYSNHLHALSYCCHKLKIRFTAIVRGDYSTSPTPMLIDIKHWGCDIEYVTKKQYQKRYDSDYLQAIRNKHTDAVIIPEGGSQQSALPGIKEMVTEFSRDYDAIICPVASSGTFAGLIKHCSNSKALHGIAMLKGKNYLEEEVLKLFPNAKLTSNWKIHHDYHCGGYAKKTTELTDFCQLFRTQTNIPVEPVYSGKMLWGLKQLIESRFLPIGSKILAIHTGGLQGQR
jgi:1-aminocyclopropane-1-carboxylate deaminase